MTPKIKHFSFDLWLTLIKSNPIFKKERVLYFYKNYNEAKKTIEEIENIFRHVDLMCNNINEKTGSNIHSEEMYLMVLYKLNVGSEYFQNVDTDSLYLEMEKLFFKHNPALFSVDTINCLEIIKQNGDNTISLLSNTGFIKGYTLRKLLEHLGISKYFDFQIYSDEEKISKPNKEIFELLITNAKRSNSKKSIEKLEIMHIGDNPNADINGANSVGIRSCLINSNGKSITQVLNHA